MAEYITLKIWTPEKLAFDQKIYRVVLPIGNNTLTIIANRAPTSLVISAGVMQLLNPDDSVKDWYFVDRGIADIANNECKISTLHLIHHSQINIPDALEMKEKEPENAAFYQKIATYLQIFSK